MEVKYDLIVPMPFTLEEYEKGYRYSLCLMSKNELSNKSNSAAKITLVNSETKKSLENFSENQKKIFEEFFKISKNSPIKYTEKIIDVSKNVQIDKNVPSN